MTTFLNISREPLFTESEIAGLPAIRDANQRQHYVYNILAMQSSCEFRGIEFRAILPPLLLPEFKPSMSSIEQMYFWAKQQDYAKRGHVNYQSSMLRAYRVALLELKTRLGSRFVDMSTLWQDEERPMYADWYHYNDVGCSLIAKRLAPIVEAAAMETTRSKARQPQAINNR